MSKTGSLDDFYLYEHYPDKIEYLYFHDTLDLCCWLFKLRFSPQEYLKKRKYRLDIILDGMLKESKLSARKVKKTFGSKNSRERLIFHLKKGWYNELVRLNPFPKDLLEIGTNPEISSYIGLSPSWNVIQAYYSIYEYTNSMVFTNIDSLRTEQHRKSSNFFNKNLLSKLSGVTAFYPFNIVAGSMEPMLAYRGIDKDFWKYKYARSPRFREKTIYELEDIYLRFLSEEKTFLDFMYKFRVWANYLGIDTILSLEEGYLLGFLYKNLALVCFLFGAMAEITAIAFLGEEEVIKLLQDFSFSFTLKHANFRENWFLIPSFVRFRIYHKNGLINNLPDFLMPPNSDPLLI